MQSSYFSYLSYKYQFSRSSLFTPIILFQFGEKNQFDGNLKYTYQTGHYFNYSAILTYKSNNVFMITLDACRFQFMSLGYGIEFNKSNMISNQVFLKYQFNRTSCGTPEFW